jgi:signal transduction histidine kinase/ligand-binding sensor domain-containing protein
VPRFVVKSWQSEDGLPGNVIRAILKDEQGYLWIGTAEGLVRFDGNRFYMPNLPGDEIWHQPVRQIYQCHNQIWVAQSYGGLFRIDHGELIPVMEPSPGFKGNEVYAVTEQANGAVLIHKGEDLWNYSAEGKLTRAGSASAPENMMKPAEDIRFTDRKGRTWYQDQNQQIMVRLADDAAPTIAISPQSQNYKIAEFHEDQLGVIWATTKANGLLAIYETKVNPPPHPVAQFGPACSVAMQDHADQWWGASRDGEITFAPPGKEPSVLTLSTSVNRAVACFFLTKNNQLIVSTKEGLCFIFQGQIFVPLTQEVEASKINAVAESDDGTLYLGGAYGMSHIDADGVFHKINDSEILSGASITCSVIGNQNELYAGTTDGRILHYQGDHVTDVSPPPLSRNRHISSMLRLPDGTLLAASLGGGLLCYRNQSWRHYDESTGLPDTRITALCIDDHEHLWLASLGGIFRISLKQISQQVEELQVLWLNRSDGMSTRECNGLTHPGIFKAKDGSLYVPTTDGIAHVIPENFLLQGQLPKVFIESCTIDNERFALSNQDIHVGPGPQSVRWDFSSPDLISPEKVRFVTRLLPLQKNWQPMRTDRELSFESLPHGSYQLEVAAINGDGIHSAVAKSPRLIIHPHWWQKPWFQFATAIGALVLASMIAATLMRMRLKRRIQSLKLKNAQENERARIARDLHDDLGASLTEISLIAAMHNPDHDNKVLSLIAAKSHTLITSLDEIVWAINPRHDSSESIMEYLTAYAKEFLQQADIPLRIHLIPPIEHIAIDAERRHDLFLCVRESLNNIVKHSQASQVTLTFSMTTQNLTLEISDNGQGFAAPLTSLGDGLENIRQRLLHHSGQATIQSSPGQGTTITLVQPWN